MSAWPVILGRLSLPALVVCAAGCGVDSTRKMWAYQPRTSPTACGYVELAGIRAGQALATPATVIADTATDKRTYEAAAVVVVVAVVVVAVACFSGGTSGGNLNLGNLNFGGGGGSSDDRSDDAQHKKKRSEATP